MNNTFQKLTPTDKVDLLVYEDAFKYIFENDDIKIARMKRNTIFGGFCNLMMLLEEMDYIIFIQE